MHGVSVAFYCGALSTQYSRRRLSNCHLQNQEFLGSVESHSFEMYNLQCLLNRQRCKEIVGKAVDSYTITFYIPCLGIVNKYIML